MTIQKQTPIEEKEIRGLNVGTLKHYIISVIITVASIVSSYFGIKSGQDRISNDLNVLKNEVQSNSKINSLKIETIQADIKRIDIQLKELDTRLTNHITGER